MSKYAVDVHWDVAKVFYDIDAASPEEAERIVAEKCRELNVAPCDAVLYDWRMQGLRRVRMVTRSMFRERRIRMVGMSSIDCPMKIRLMG